jgi:hypothetical protein
VLRQEAKHAAAMMDLPAKKDVAGYKTIVLVRESFISS